MASKLRANALQTLARSVRASAISPAPLRPHLRPYPSLPRTLQPAQFSRRYAHAIPKPSRPAPPAASSPSEEIKQRKLQEPHYELTFTCVPCSERSTHTVSKQGYHKGSVLITCPSCRNRHIISDHLNIFGNRSITVEDLMRERGQLVKRGTLGEDGDVEFWEDGTVTERNKESETKTATSSSAHSDGASASQQPSTPLTDSPARPQLGNAHSSATNTTPSNRREFSTFGPRGRNHGMFSNRRHDPNAALKSALRNLDEQPTWEPQFPRSELGRSGGNPGLVTSQRNLDVPGSSKKARRPRHHANRQTPPIHSGRSTTPGPKTEQLLSSTDEFWREGSAAPKSLAPKRPVGSEVLVSASGKGPEVVSQREADPPPRVQFKLRKFKASKLIPKAEKKLYGKPEAREKRQSEINLKEAAERKARKEEERARRKEERAKDPKWSPFTLRKYDSTFDIPGYIVRALPKRETGSTGQDPIPDGETTEASSPVDDGVLRASDIPSTKLRRRETTSFVYAWPSDGMEPVRIGVTRPRRRQRASEEKSQGD
ncbi:hypothetical protein PG991_003837 [Apiospora marii]|uniref:DNL-type domain-containing protein n=1 Tax=Apiospora marii TaxID=335849 RepID=A0ABR1S4Q9_9PEZI